MTEQIGIGPEDRIRRIVEDAIHGSPLFLVEIQVRGRKGSQIVDVFIDSDEALDVEALAKVSRQVGFLLDTEDVLKGAYHLNVSSPGVDRPLTLPRQFKKNVGRKLKVKYAGPDGSVSEIQGVLIGVEGEELILEAASSDEIRLPMTQVVEARVMLPW